MRAYELVLQRVEEDLSAGILAVGDRLPGERALAETMSVSRASVREAIRVLEAMGVVRTAVGSGPESGAIITADAGTPIGSALRLHVATKLLPIDDVVQTRILLETWAIRQSAARKPIPDLAGVTHLLDAADDPALTPEEFLRLDATFHVALSSLAGNVVVEAMMTSLRAAIQSYVVEGVPRLQDWASVRKGLTCEHREIVAAVRKGHGAKASELLCSHIEGYFALIQQ